MRICDNCGKIMNNGYVFGEGDCYYCSNACLYANYTAEEYQIFFDSDNAYYTEWDCDPSNCCYLKSNGLDVNFCFSKCPIKIESCFLKCKKCGAETALSMVSKEVRYSIPSSVRLPDFNNVFVDCIDIECVIESYDTILDIFYRRGSKRYVTVIHDVFYCPSCHSNLEF